MTDTPIGLQTYKQVKDRFIELRDIPWIFYFDDNKYAFERAYHYINGDEFSAIIRADPYSFYPQIGNVRIVGVENAIVLHFHHLFDIMTNQKALEAAKEACYEVIEYVIPLYNKMESPHDFDLLLNEYQTKLLSNTTTS